MGSRSVDSGFVGQSERDRERERMRGRERETERLSHDDMIAAMFITGARRKDQQRVTRSLASPRAEHYWMPAGLSISPL